MTWRDAIRSASFRGVPFVVEGSTARFGRRVAVHEYPQRDIPYHEDMGRATRTFTVRGLVGGDGQDYRARRDALLDAIETPGPGQLVHPTYGEMTVVVLSADTTESSRDGGVWRFSLVCQESGALVFPAPTQDTPTASSSAADAVYDAQGDDFLASWTIEDMPDWVADDAITQVLAQRQTILDTVTGPHASTVRQMDELQIALDALEAAVNEDVSIVTDPDTLLSSLTDIYQRITSLPVLRELTAAAGAQASTSATTTDALAAEGNREALDRLLYRCLLGEHARALSLEDLGWLQRAELLRDELTARIGAEEDLGGPAHSSLLDLRVAVVQDVAARATDLPSMRTETVQTATPTLAIAARLYGDAHRAAEITERNHIPHPLFAVGQMEVLSA